MEAHKRTIGNLFQPEGRFVAPLYQRPYVWDEEHWAALWEAISGTAERQLTGLPRRPYFLGAVVLEQLPVPTGQINARELIDGQQRLISLQLCIAALRDLCTDGTSAQYRDAFARMTRNQSPVAATEEERFKVWPTNLDQSRFLTAMTAGSAAAVSKLESKIPAIDARLARAYRFFAQEAQEWLADDDPKRLPALWTTLTEDLQVVAIDLDLNDDAQQIFETLNFYGERLLPADLVKNFLLRAAQQRGLDVANLYERYWKAFDVDQGYWRQEVRQGRLKRPRIDLFLQHYLTLQTRREVLIANLFGEFRDLSTGSGASIEEQLATFRTYADIYRDFERVSPHQSFFRRLTEDLDTTTALPLLLEVFKRSDEFAERGAVESDLESYLVRRLVCGLTTKAYNRVFVAMLQRLSNEADFSSVRIRQALLELEGESSRWPADAEFEYKWTTERLYRTQRQSRVRMILERLEQAMHTTKTEAIEFKEQLTIEHVMPQDWEANWPLAPATQPLVAKQIRDSLVQTVGNLTLLTQPLNSGVSNGPWALKKPEIDKFSLLRLNKSWPDQWDEAAIQERAKELFAFALQLWARPHTARDEKLWQPTATTPTGPQSPAAHDQLAFWEGFLKHYQEARSTLPARVPQARNWFPFRLGRAGFSVNAKVGVVDDWIACELYVQREDAKQIFDELESQRAGIEAELHTVLDWQRMPTAKACRIIQTKAAEVRNRETWPAAFAWLQDRSEAFIKTFGPRVEALKGP